MIRIIQAGIQTIIQDQGRNGYQAYGISAGGAMSKFSSRLSNTLVGNEMNSQVLEIVQSPNSFLFEADAVVCFCGGGLIPETEGKELPLFQPVYIEAGKTIQLKKPMQGFRLYMAVAGGFEAEHFLNSCSTDLKCKAGGFKGRPLKKDDMLLIKNDSSFLSENIKGLLKRNLFFNLDKTLSPKIFSKTIRVMKGNEWDLLSTDSKELFSSQKFMVSNDSNRMGLRLKSVALQLSHQKEMISTAVAKGTIQLLPDGQLIALMADCQTVGGYPRIAQIIEADHCICGQLRPGDEISLSLISLAEAEQLFLEQEQRLQTIQATIQKIFS